MNGFDLAGRPIRVGLGNDKFTPESTANLLQRFSGQNQPYQGSAFSGAGGRGPQSSAFDRAGGRDSDKAGGASALDDTDVAGVNFNNYSRDALMRKLARTDEASTNGTEERQILKPKTETKPLPVNVNMASRCVILRNMFDANEYVMSTFYLAQPLCYLCRLPLTPLTGKKVKTGLRNLKKKSNRKPRINTAMSFMLPSTHISMAIYT
jgi:hypothetical protein